MHHEHLRGDDPRGTQIEEIIDLIQAVRNVFESNEDDERAKTLTRCIRERCDALDAVIDERRREYEESRLAATAPEGGRP